VEDHAAASGVPRVGGLSTAVKAVVVGGGSGIGAAVAARQRASGAEVVVWDATDRGDILCDISAPEQVDAATEATLAELGAPTHVTVTAGIGHAGMLLDATPDEWDRVVGVNAKGVWLVMRALARPMIAAGRGSFVATSSVSSHLVDRSMGLYCASKAALDMVIKVAAAEWGPTLRVNGVAPGVTDTPMLGPARRDGSWLTKVGRRTALGRLGTADDIAEAVLAVHRTGWITGQIIVCDGGLVLRSPINPLGQ
jgi:NAD(P)-dependent dehydrogenase (short-subunit alcohol dehydrogenase family)